MGRLVLFVVLLVSSISLARSQADGNPHGWDRRRRCDHDSYTPQCGACEGYGGIPYGDKNEEIYLTTCEPANSTSIPVKPKWGPVFTVNYYNEVLIGHKTDPFCFNAFPSNDSRGERRAGSARCSCRNRHDPIFACPGELCYRADSGQQTYNAKTLR